jgi:hypothetical protein
MPIRRLRCWRTTNVKCGRTGAGWQRLSCNSLASAVESETADERVDRRDPAGTVCAPSAPHSAPLRVDRRCGRGVIPRPGPACVGRPGLDRRRAIQLGRGMPKWDDDWPKKSASFIRLMAVTCGSSARRSSPAYSPADPAPADTAADALDLAFWSSVRANNEYVDRPGVEVSGEKKNAVRIDSDHQGFIDGAACRIVEGYDSAAGVRNCSRPGGDRPVFGVSRAAAGIKTIMTDDERTAQIEQWNLKPLPAWVGS